MHCLTAFHSCSIVCPQDLVDAIAHVRHGNTIASQHRKRAASLPTRLAGLVMGSLNTSGVGFIKSMTPVERHAELVYAESLFEKVCRLPFFGITFGAFGLSILPSTMYCLWEPEAQFEHRCKYKTGA